MKSNKRKNKGISLIVLVITIIIMIILAGAIILSLSGTGLITNATKGSFQSDISTMQEELGVYIANKITETKGKYTQEKLYADKDNLEENGEKVSGKNIKDVLDSLDKKYLDEVEIINGKVVYVGDNTNKLKWANEILLGIKKELKENTSETESITLEESAKLNLVGYRIYGNSKVSETGEIQSVGDSVIDLTNWMQGHIYGSDSAYNIRIRLANYIESKTGITYKISTVMPDNMQLVVYNGTFTTYPFNIDKVVYDSGWKNNDITFTSEIDGNITMSIRYKDDSNISPDDIIKNGVKVELESTESIDDKCKIPIQITGKNLLNIDEGLSSVLIQNSDGTYTLTKPSENIRISDVIPLYIPANTSIAKSVELIEFSVPNETWKRIPSIIYFADGTAIGEVWYPNTSGSANSVYHVVKYDKDIIGIKLYLTSEWEVGSYITFKNMQLEIGDGWTSYEPYVNDRYNIYLDEPLRKVDNYVDYIDVRTQEVVRNVEEVDGVLKGLSTPKVEKISLPSILLKSEVSKITINTDVLPSKMEMLYYTK